MTRVDEAILSQGFLAEVRETLMRSRAALVELDQANDGGSDPAGSSWRSSLDEVEAALARLDDGTFGRCTACGHAIPAERVEFMPSAGLCVGCQHDHETRAF